MVRSIVKDALFLGLKSEPATQKDIVVIDDLLDTLKANAEHCVGLAANMIGVKKRIIEHLYFFWYLYYNILYNFYKAILLLKALLKKIKGSHFQVILF
jgi:hypothetical protein